MKHIYIYISLIILFGCGKGGWSDGQINTIEFPEHDPRIAATLIIEQDASSFSALIRSSASIENENISTALIEDAEVIIKEENDAGQELYSTSLGSIALDGELYSSTSSEAIDLDTNIPISLMINADGFNPIFATTEMPETPSLEDSLSYTKMSEFFTDVEDWYGDIYDLAIDRVELSFEDNTSIPQYFMLDVQVSYFDTINGLEIDSSLYKEKGLYNFNIYSPDPRISYYDYNGANTLLFDDVQGLNSIIILLEHSVDELDTYNKFEIQYKFNISALSSSVYNHYLSVNELATWQNPFQEPQLAFTNFEPDGDGFGCFGMINSIHFEVP